MGFWKEIREEWSWNSIQKSWPDLVSVFIAASIAFEFHKPLWKFFLVWLCVFHISRFAILSMTKLIKKN